MSTPADVLNSGLLPEPSGLLNQIQQRYAEDASLHVQFHVEAVHNEFQSEALGRVVFEDKVFIRIMVPGDKTSIVDRQATPEDKRRFSAQFAKFREDQEQTDTGTPLTMVPWLTPAQAAEYKFFNIFTVEQLAECPDSNGQKFVKFFEHKAKAKGFLEGLVPDNVQKELDARDEQITEQKNQLLATERKLKALEKQLAKLSEA